MNISNRTPRQQSGFTLLEVIVVVVIIAILVGFASLSIGDRTGELLHTEVKRVKVLLQMAREEAMLEGREYAIGFWQGGYNFFELDDEEKWVAMPGSTGLKNQKLPESLEIALELEGQLIILESKPAERPQVFLMSSGEMTPFLIQLKTLTDDRDPVEIYFDELGRPRDENESG